MGANRNYSSEEVQGMVSKLGDSLKLTRKLLLKCVAKYVTISEVRFNLIRSLKKLEWITDRYISLIGDGQSFHVINRTQNQIKALLSRIDNSQIGTITEVKEIVRSTLNRLSEVSIDTKYIDTIKKSQKSLGDLSYYLFLGSNDPISAIEAPVVFTLRNKLSPPTLSKIKQAFDIQPTFGETYYIRSAKFAVFNKEKDKGKLSIQDRANAFCSLLNQREGLNLIPMHDVSLENEKFYIVWFPTSDYAKYIAELINDSILIKIMIKMKGDEKESKNE